MPLLSLDATTWSIASQSPLLIASTKSEQQFFVRLLDNRSIELLPSPEEEAFTSVDAELDLSSLSLSTSEDEQYLYLICGKSGFQASVKREHEGVVVDVFGPDDGDDVDTCCAFYAELQTDESDIE